jgi:hypothetical protein
LRRSRARSPAGASDDAASRGRHGSTVQRIPSLHVRTQLAAGSRKFPYGRDHCNICADSPQTASAGALSRHGDGFRTPQKVEGGWRIFRGSLGWGRALRPSTVRKDETVCGCCRRV